MATSAILVLAIPTRTLLAADKSIINGTEGSHVYITLYTHTHTPTGDRIKQMYVTVGRPWLLQHTTTKKGKTVYNFTLDKKVSIIIIIIIIYVIITGACMARYTQLYVCLRRELNKMEIEKKTNEKFA